MPHIGTDYYRIAIHYADAKVLKVFHLFRLTGEVRATHRKRMKTKRLREVHVKKNL
jgi:hypothetical protein